MGFTACPDRITVGVRNVYSRFSILNCDSRTDVTLKSASYLQEYLKDPVFAKSEEPNETALDKAFRSNLDFWDFLELPENAYRLKRFGIAMKGFFEAQDPKALIDSKKDCILLRKKRLLISECSSSVGADSRGWTRD